MTTLSFAIDGKPQGKQRARRGKGGRWYTPRETVAFEARVRNAAFVEMVAKGIGKRYEDPVVMGVRCYFPDGHVRDGDNVLKAVQDALNGLVYVDDHQVYRAAVEHCIDREHPRTEVTVTYEAHRRRRAQEEPRHRREGGRPVALLQGGHLPAH